MDFKAFIFDLDGTLLDTLPDLVRLTNRVLEDAGWPTRTTEQILSYVGDGGRMLLRRAAPAQASDAQLEAAFSRWEELYPTYGHSQTKPYPGIPSALEELKSAGCKLAVLSNKFDGAVGQVIADQFPGMFDEARGECAEIPRKPDPAGLRFMLRKLGVTPEEAAFVGDAPTDMEVARLAGVFSIGVTWGYNSEESLVSAGAQCLISRPQELTE